ncbi:MAG TPA: AMP-binding protein [Gaiellaceae bacterium]|nr:AMP-binding protein [Gaiellaceae bacterium]
MPTTAELIRRGARQHGDRTALLCGDERLTFAETDALACRLAGALRAHGRERVGLLVDNRLESVPLDFACVKAGIARVPLNSRLAPPEMAEILRVAGATLVVSDRPVELGVETLPLDELLAEAAGLPAEEPPVEPGLEDDLLLLATSGTTGRLKLVRHTQASYAAIVANILANLVRPRRDDVMLHAASLIHASGTFVLPFWLHGAASAVLPGFAPAEFLAAIPRWRVTHANVVPTMLTALLAARGDEDLSSLRCVVYGASPMPRPLLERAIAEWGPIFVQYYGQTEAPLCIAVLRPEDHAGERLLACGQPAVDAEVALDPASGEILVRAPFAARGYVGDPELSAATFQADGWVRTRDVGRVDDEGFLYLVDRTSDMIVTGGYNVYPREVEDALAAHPGVRECVVVGAPDETWVEAVTAFVVPVDGVSEAELLEHCRGLLAGYKVPKSVRFVGEIPKSPVGKLLRRALRDPLWAGSAGDEAADARPKTAATPPASPPGEGRARQI